MSPETDKYEDHTGHEAPHSAFEEFSRDERRPAVILLSALILAAAFFALGIMFGRWTAEPPAPRASTTPSTAPAQTPPAPPATTAAPQQSAATAQQPAAETRSGDDKKRRYALLVADLKTKEAADSLVKSLERAGYKNVRIEARPGASGSTISVLIGRFTRDEAEAEAARLKEQGGPRMKNVRVVEETAG
ncbi:MAG TPA: SPOR domain-containing protein [Pyrinomonadaceae bacterium]|jgi:cell division septation protein DedD